MNTIPTAMVFDFVLRFPDGQYFTGPTRYYKNGKHDHTTFLPTSVGPKDKAFTMTVNKAYALIDHTPGFSPCVAERLPL